MLRYIVICCYLPNLLPKFILWQMLLPIVCGIQHILWQVLYQYMVGDVKSYVIADVIAHVKQGGRCCCHLCYT